MIKWKWALFLLVLTVAVVGGCSSSSEPDASAIYVLLSSNVRSGEAPFDVDFTLSVIGKIARSETEVPAYHFNSGQGTVSDIVDYSIPDSTAAVLRTYSWSTTYSGDPRLCRAVAYLKLVEGNVYSDTLIIHVE
jgi:hypothetical protein